MRFFKNSDLAIGLIELQISRFQISQLCSQCDKQRLEFPKSQ